MPTAALRCLARRHAPLLALVLLSACGSDAAEVAVPVEPADVQVADLSCPDTAVPDTALPDTGPALELPVGCSADTECAVPSACIIGTCVAGKCQFATSTGACDDGNACTADDACQGGACVGGRVVSCDDGLACTSDGCDLLAGCVHTNLTGPCSDGNACTTGDQCAVGACAGSAADCDDHNPCTTDGCDAALGCTHTPAPGPCDDGNACTTTDTCADGQCAGVAIVCDDQDPCTADGCDAATGCVTTPSPQAPACGALSCDPSKLGPLDARPVCPETDCTPVCEPVDPSKCVVVGGVYRCEPPTCSCGDTKKAVACTLPPPKAVCDPICEPPKCVTECANNACGNESCPLCEATCGAVKCAAKCQAIEGSGPCGSVFGCAFVTPTCTTSCKPVNCGWVNYDDPSAPPTCEAASPATMTEQPGLVGASCGADGTVTPKAWGVVCQKPECEISCPNAVLAGCSAPANCQIDCTNPECSVACDPPVCAKNAGTGLYTCEPPANCVTTCQCAVGICSRAI